MASSNKSDNNSNYQSDIFFMRNMPVPQENENMASVISGFKENVVNASDSTKSTSEVVEKNGNEILQTKEEESLNLTENADSANREILALDGFEDHLSIIMKETVAKIMAKSKELLAMQKIAEMKEKERYESEKQALNQEINECHHAIETLKMVAHKNTETLMSMDKKLEQQQNRNVLTRSFLAWRTAAREQKRKDLLVWMATKHYEEKLKRKVFNAWLSHLKLCWKKKMELKITMDVYENQKAIVQNYEAKIRDLQENASEVDKRLRTLHRSFEDSMQMAYMQGLTFTKERIMGSNNQRDFASEQFPTEDRLKKVAWSTSICERCQVQSKVEPDGSTSIYSDTPPVNYRNVKEIVQKPMTKVHPSALPKRLPIMGTAIPHSHPVQNKTSSISLLSDNDQSIIIERHIPVVEPSSSHFLPSSSQFLPKNGITKNRNQKKML